MPVHHLELCCSFFSSFAPVKDARLTVTPELQVCDDSVLVLLHLGSERLGGSALAQVYSQLGDQSPDVEDPQALKAMLNLLIDWKRQGKILAMHDRSDGGLLTTMLEMSFAARTGINIELADEASLLRGYAVGFMARLQRSTPIAPNVYCHLDGAFGLLESGVEWAAALLQSEWAAPLGVERANMSGVERGAPLGVEWATASGGGRAGTRKMPSCG